MDTTSPLELTGLEALIAVADRQPVEVYTSYPHTYAYPSLAEPIDIANGARIADATPEDYAREARREAHYVRDEGIGPESLALDRLCTLRAIVAERLCLAAGYCIDVAIL